MRTFQGILENSGELEQSDSILDSIGGERSTRLKRRLFAENPLLCPQRDSIRLD